MATFALAALLASWWGWSPRRATVFGVLAGAFATVPDIDMAYALIGMMAHFEGLLTVDEAFWTAAGVTHRTVTHALPIALVMTGLVVMVHHFGVRRRAVLPAVAVVSVLVGGVTLWSGPLAGAIMALFGLGVIAVATAARVSDLPTSVVGLAAGLGLLTHPFGDLFTGMAPPLFYPFTAPLEISIITLHPDPTLHLLGAFFLELGVIWAAVLVYAGLHDWPVLPAIRPRATVGLGYAGAVFVIPEPSLDVPVPFVLSVLALGILAMPLRRSDRVPMGWRVPITALTAVTVGALAYTIAYLLV